MIGNIKNAWLRRAALVAVSPLVLTANVVFGLALGCVCAFGDVRDAWRGPSA